MDDENAINSPSWKIGSEKIMWFKWLPITCGSLVSKMSPG